MVRILARAMSFDDSVAIYRILPYLDLRNVDLKMPGEKAKIGIRDAMYYDVLFCSRPHTLEDEAVINLFRLCGKKVIVDWDDDPFNIPEDNKAYGTYSQYEKHIRRCIELASVVTVSTQNLKEMFDVIFRDPRLKIKDPPRIEVVQNAMSNHFLGFRQNNPRRNVMIWRGSDTHTKDLMTIAHAIFSTQKLAIENGWSYCFLGMYPWFLVDKMDPKIYRYYSDMHYTLMLETIVAIAPKIGLVPLNVSPFNLSKSNIGWQEFTLGGAVTVAPKIPEFERPGILNYDSPEGVVDLFEKILTGKMTDGKLANLQAESTKELMDEYVTDEANIWRAQILESILRIPHSPKFSVVD